MRLEELVAELDAHSRIYDDAPDAKDAIQDIIHRLRVEGVDGRRGCWPLTDERVEGVDGRRDRPTSSERGAHDERARIENLANTLLDHTYKMGLYADCARAIYINRRGWRLEGMATYYQGLVELLEGEGETT